MKKNIYTYCFIFFVSVCFLSKQGVAQESNLLRELRIPQIAQENPGALIPFNGHVAFPGAGRIQLGVSLPLSYGDIYSISDKTMKKIKRNITFENTNQIDILNLGFRFSKKNYISLFATVKTDMHISFKRDLASFIIEGNAAHEGKTMSFLGNDFLSINAYAEFGVGYNREVNENLSFGVNAKYLLGLVNAYTKKATLDLLSENRFEALTLTHSAQGNFACVLNFDEAINHINKYGFEGFGDSVNLNIDYSDIPQNLKNDGFALDLGGRYRINKWFEVSASVLDLGFIKWKTNPRQYNVKERVFSIMGYSYDDVVGGNDDISDFDYMDYLTGIADSLGRIFGSELLPSGSYTKMLNTKINIGGSFFLNENHRFNAIFNGNFVNGTFIPSGTISYTFTAGKWFDLVVGNTFRRNAILNPGVGVNFTAAIFQFYAVVNYANTLIYIDKAKNLNFALGINFVAPQKKEKNVKASYPY